MSSRYRNIPRNKTEEGTQYISSTIYPVIPPSEDDIYIISKSGDRFDILSTEYYKDVSLWWIIASTNPSASIGGLSVRPGIQLRIPQPKERALELFEQVNERR